MNETLKEIINEAQGKIVTISLERYNELICAQATLAMLLKLGLNMKAYEFAEVLRVLAAEEKTDAE